VQQTASGSTAGCFGDGQEVTVTAHVIVEGNLEEESPGAWRQRIDIETEQITSDDHSENVHAGLRLNVYSKSSTRYDLGTDAELPEEEQKVSSKEPETRLFRYGERLRFTAKLNAPRNFGS